MKMPHHRVTLEEYLKLEEKSEEWLEYIDGFVVAKVPADNHAEISTNFTLRLAPIVRPKGCIFRSGDGKVIVKDDKTKKETHMIPDIVVSCDPRDIAHRDANASRGGKAIVRYPWLVIEILSPGTQKKDREGKFFAYQSIKELTHYVLIRSRRREMKVFERLADGRLATPGPVDQLILHPLGEQGMSINEVYENTITRQKKVVRGPRI